MDKQVIEVKEELNNKVDSVKIQMIASNAQVQTEVIGLNYQVMEVNSQLSQILEKLNDKNWDVYKSLLI